MKFSQLRVGIEMVTEFAKTLSPGGIEDLDVVVRCGDQEFSTVSLGMDLDNQGTGKRKVVIKVTAVGD